MKTIHNEIDVERKEDHELNHQPEQGAYGLRDRYRQSREIDLREDPGVPSKGVLGSTQTVIEVPPEKTPRHIEQEVRNSIGGKLGDLSKNESIYQCSKNWGKGGNRADPRLSVYIDLLNPALQTKRLSPCSATAPSSQY